ncbi:MAG: UDP-N-acetylglucosamine 1-carboxyvinyltransferase [Candidatus Pelagibacterales bacterium]|nr:MAG: UDP-N-acetylglucosamine 1-carboxyvinyltransferase [Pelagibacterales bacterium]
MEKLEITGDKKLQGSINISGSKNASLPILAASILSNKIILTNVPAVKDIDTMLELLTSLGSVIKINKNRKTIIINNNKTNKTHANYKLVKTMRAGILVLGSLLSRFNKAKVSLPGGCAIGLRPVNIHIDALKKMGVKVKIIDGYIHAVAKNGLKGAKIKFQKISVGATENLLIAAVKAKGRTVLSNCAIEPEVKDLCNFLIKLGGKIKWIGKRKIQIDGVKKLKDINYKVMFDRIEAGTYMIVAAATKSRIAIKNINPKIINKEIFILKKIGVKIIEKKKKITVIGPKILKSINIKTSPYPGFPTDLQAQLMALMCIANKQSIIEENIFENRFMHVSELNRMGADIVVKGRKAIIKGNKKLNGAELMATDLRASVSLVIAALISSKKSTINRIYHLDRGYENIEKKLSKCGAKIKRIK